MYSIAYTILYPTAIQPVWGTAFSLWPPTPTWRNLLNNSSPKVLPICADVGFFQNKSWRLTAKLHWVKLTVAVWEVGGILLKSRCLRKTYPFNVNLCLATQRQKLLSSSWVGVWEANIPTFPLIRRSVYLPQVVVVVVALLYKQSSKHFERPPRDVRWNFPETLSRDNLSSEIGRSHPWVYAILSYPIL